MEKTQKVIPMEDRNPDKELLLKIGEMQGDLKAVMASSARIELAMANEKERSEDALNQLELKIDLELKDTQARLGKLESFKMKLVAVVAGLTIAVNLAKEGVITALTKVFPL